MKILVTGGTGFIGRYLVRYLLKKGNEITIFDNFSNSSKESINSLKDKGMKIIEGDITKIENILNSIPEQDIVIHLAAQISVEESMKNTI